VAGEMSRRALGQLFLALPAARLAASSLATDERPSPEADFIATHEPGLSAEERERLKKGLADQEKALKTVRDFPLPFDLPPALHFRPLPSKRG
jgi:hypothetical protein